MTTEQVHLLQHALGLDEYGQGRMYRNHYVGGEHECRPLVAMGYMIERPPSELTGGSPLFLVTDAGKAAVQTESPKPPKLTRSQRRYRAYLNADSSLSFMEWLKYYGKEVAR